jgi:plasmid stabilization system protein ParE
VTGGVVRVHPSALEETEAAIAWYGERSEQAAAAFLNEIDRAITAISNRPKQYPVFALDTRRAVLRLFPYVIVFREVNNGIEIIALMHGRRRPGYWSDRL